MRPLSEANAQAFSDVKILFTDIDDTLTDRGLLPDFAYSALFSLVVSGIEVVPVTGRPAGWGDFIAYSWPVKAVIVENGAAIIRRQGDRIAYEVDPEADPPERLARFEELKRFAASLERPLPLAADQPYRRWDLAFDYNERAGLSRDLAELVADRARAIGLHARVSSVHVNVAAGPYSKARAALRYLSSIGFGDPMLYSRAAAFIGDSENDEPMFEALPLSCGVANIEESIARMATHPAYVTSAYRSKGFLEFCEFLRNSKSSR
jgi:hypothetical protein